MENKNLEGLEYVCIRTYSAGVHFGYLKSCKPSNDGYYEVELLQSRRLWSWSGANTLSDLSENGSIKPEDCKFTLPVSRIKLMAIEVIYVSENGKKNLDAIPIWTLKQ
jgi:hypothetical protein